MSRRPLAASKAGAGGSHESHEQLQDEWVGGFERGEGKRARDSYSGVGCESPARTHSSRVRVRTAPWSA